MKRKLEILILILSVVSLMVFLGSPALCADIDLTTGLPFSSEVTPGAVEPISTIAQGGNVLWDTFHGAYGYTPSGLYSTLASVLTAKGYTIDENNSGILNLNLNNYDIVVICVGSAWDSAYSAAEVTALENFVAGGGGLLIMGDNEDVPNANINPVSQAFGTTLGLTLISPYDLYVSNMTSHPIFQGVSEFYMRAAGEIIGSPPSSEEAWTGAGEAVVTVAEVGSGHVVALGDINLFDNNYITASNQLFAENIFDWLVTPACDYCLLELGSITRWCLNVETATFMGLTLSGTRTFASGSVHEALATYLSQPVPQTLALTAVDFDGRFHFLLNARFLFSNIARGRYIRSDGISGQMDVEIFDCNSGATAIPESSGPYDDKLN